MHIGCHVVVSDPPAWLRGNPATAVKGETIAPDKVKSSCVGIPPDCSDTPRFSAGALAVILLNQRQAGGTDAIAVSGVPCTSFRHQVARFIGLLGDPFSSKRMNESLHL